MLTWSVWRTSKSIAIYRCVDWLRSIMREIRLWPTIISCSWILMRWKMVWCSTNNNFCGIIRCIWLGLRFSRSIRFYSTARIMLTWSVWRASKSIAIYRCVDWLRHILTTIISSCWSFRILTIWLCCVFCVSWSILGWSIGIIIFCWYKVLHFSLYAHRTSIFSILWIFMKIQSMENILVRWA